MVWSEQSRLPLFIGSSQAQFSGGVLPHACTLGLNVGSVCTCGTICCWVWRLLALELGALGWRPEVRYFRSFVENEARLSLFYDSVSSPRALLSYFCCCQCFQWKKFFFCLFNICLVLIFFLLNVAFILVFIYLFLTGTSGLRTNFY